MNEDFESYNITDEEEVSGAEGRRYTMWRLVPLIMIMPTIGWEKVRENGPSPELAVIRFFLPLCLVAGASVFLAFLYPHQSGLAIEENKFTLLLVNSVIVFCSFFIGYYLALVMQKIFLPKDMRGFPHTPFAKLLTLTGVATLAIFHILFEALPMLDSILVFLPLWTIFIIFKGLQSAKIKSDKSLLAIGVVCIVVIAAPSLVKWVLILFT